MPFRDHFRPPVSKRHSWEEVHGGWPMMIVQKLAPLLPEGYQAAPRVHLGSYFEVDIGAFENDDAPTSRPHLAGEGGVATVPEAELSLETDSSDVSEYEVLIYDVQQEKRLVAAIEIISPANKDRPEPDVLVIPSDHRPFDRQDRDVRSVIVAFEVLSPSTKTRDLRWKRTAYTGLPSLTHSVVIAQDAVKVVVFARDEDFAERQLRSIGETIDLPSLGVSLPVAEIYRDTGLA